MDTLENLLEQIHEINKRYDEIAKLSGDNFNIFEILKLSSNELKHSLFIASLLNPKGSHAQGSLFLKLFLKEISFKVEETNAKEINILENSKVETEKFIGKVGKNTGGRIDIVITLGNKQQILIENKIYAGDQKNQLQRYKNHSKDVSLFYLTLKGREASEESVGKGDGKLTLDEDYKTISYRENIISWLEECHKEAVKYPLLRETISQYIILIKKLTGKARSKKMEKEIVEKIISSGENLKSAFSIADSINAIKKEIIDKKLNLFSNLQAIAKKKEIDFIGKEEKDFYENFLGIYWAFNFKKKEWKHLKIKFEFQKSNLEALHYGIRTQEKIEWKDLPDQIEENIDKMKTKLDRNNQPSDYFPICYSMDEYKNWDDEFFTSIVSDDSKVKGLFLTFENKVDELLQASEGLQL